MSRTPLVLIPGLLCDALLWAPQIGALSDIADCWVATPTGANSMEALAHNLLTHSPFDKFSLAGLSMGGYVALEIMRQAPDRVSRLALLDTNAHGDTPSQSDRRRELMALAQRGALDKVTELLIPALVNRARSYDPQVVGTVRTMARNIGSESFIRQEEAIMHRADSRPMLSNIKCSSLVLCGKQDTLTPPALHEEMASAISGARLIIVDDCGHLSTIEQPEEVSLAMRAWLTTE